MTPPTREELLHARSTEWLLWLTAKGLDTVSKLNAEETLKDTGERSPVKRACQKQASVKRGEEVAYGWGCVLVFRCCEETPWPKKAPAHSVSGLLHYHLYRDHWQLNADTETY